MGPVDVDGQISHFCSQGFVIREQILVNKSDKSDHPFLTGIYSVLLIFYPMVIPSECYPLCQLLHKRIYIADDFLNFKFSCLQLHFAGPTPHAILPYVAIYCPVLLCIAIFCHRSFKMSNCPLLNVSYQDPHIRGSDR